MPFPANKFRVSGSLSRKRERGHFDARFRSTNREYRVTAVLPQTGTVDDSRVFAHLHGVQEWTGKGPVVNAIEIVGGCQQPVQVFVELCLSRPVFLATWGGEQRTVNRSVDIMMHWRYALMHENHDQY